MDGLDNPQSQQQKENKGLAPRQTWLPFLEVGAFEIFFVSIILILFFGIMNYFNLLPISQLWPKQLGFLPHRPYAQSQQFNPPPVAPTIIPASSPTQLAKETFTNYLPAIVDSSLMPQPASDVNYIKEPAVTEGFTAYWSRKDAGTIKAIFSTSSSQKNIVSFILVFNKTHSEAPSAKVAQSLAPKAFLVTPKGEWNCKNLPNTPRLYCENFWEEETGVRKGIGLQGYHPLSTTKESTIFFCEHAKESTLYSWKSCLKEFAETGVQ